jgi:hypothetical protein
LTGPISDVLTRNPQGGLWILPRKTYGCLFGDIRQRCKCTHHFALA